MTVGQFGTVWLMFFVKKMNCCLCLIFINSCLLLSSGKCFSAVYFYCKNSVETSLYNGNCESLYCNGIRVHRVWNIAVLSKNELDSRLRNEAWLMAKMPPNLSVLVPSKQNVTFTIAHTILVILCGTSYRRSWTAVKGQWESGSFFNKQPFRNSLVVTALKRPSNKPEDPRNHIARPPYISAPCFCCLNLGALWFLGPLKSCFTHNFYLIKYGPFSHFLRSASHHSWLNYSGERKVQQKNHFCIPICSSSKIHDNIPHST